MRFLALVRSAATDASSQPAISGRLVGAVLTVLGDDETFATSEVHVHFLRSVREGALRIEARVVARSRRSAHTEVTMVDLAGTLVARAGATQAIRPVR